MSTKTYFCGDLMYKEIILQLLENNLKIEEVNHLDQAEFVYCVYGRGPKLNFKTLNFWLNNKQKLILHWIGTDVLTHVNKLKSNRNIRSLIYHRIWNFIIKRKTRNGSMINLCCAPWLCDELSIVGIKSEYLPLTTINKDKFNFEEVSREIDFMSYIPQNRAELYHSEDIFKLAVFLKEYKFLIIVPDINKISELSFKNIPENVLFIPKINHEEVTSLYRKSKVFLRFTEHDGLSLSVIESLANRTHVFWTYDFENVQKIKLPITENNFKLFTEALENWHPNFKGQEHVLTTLNIETIKNKFNIVLKLFFKI